MQQRTIGPFDVSAISFGCMNLSHAYFDYPDQAYAGDLLNRALDLGHTHLDTAALYGFGVNETLLGETVMHRRGEFMLSSKCGLFKAPDGGRGINGTPENIKKMCEDSLKRLKTDVIDLYYLHRLDKNVPIEDSVGAMSELVREGKVKTLGLSEIGSETLKRAHAVHPITALQTEYSLWTRNPEISVLDTCRDLGVTFVAFSPVGRGFLTDTPPAVDAMAEKDIRRVMPRFQPENYPDNLKLLDGVRAIAQEAGCTVAQLALAWLLAKDDNVVPIPGTKNIAHMEENFAAGDVALSQDQIARLDALINEKTVKGGRYSAAMQADVDTEEYA